MSHDDPEHRKERFARIRRVKNFLRFMPRRARLHKYPLIGRFAAIARKRSYLWSFKTAHVRPSFYAGSILSLMPFLGVQLPVAFLLALLLRGNFMILGGLQFITNPVTAVPVYYGTFQLGKSVMQLSGFGQSIEISPTPAFDVPPAPPPAQPAADDVNPPAELRWTARFGTSINTLLLGGLIAGAALGAILDVLWRLGARQAESRRRKVLARQAASGSTDSSVDSL
jgi:uncharacterized protein (DUF2062 family)